VHRKGVKIGRPREHGESTAAALLDAAERLVTAEGLDALSVRRVAGESGTSVRAVYSLFGSKDGLVVALGVRTYDLLRQGIDALPRTDDPAADLVDAGVGVFRRFALSHPALFQLGVQMIAVSPELSSQFVDAANRALERLHERIRRLQEAGALGNRTVDDATWEFHGLCEGLAALELRGTLPAAHAETLWRDALASLVAGWDPRRHESG
jgi:AcrR family transcriptional regulator